MNQHRSLLDSGVVSTDELQLPVGEQSFRAEPGLGFFSSG